MNRLLTLRIIIFLLLAFVGDCFSQQTKIDSLMNLLVPVNEDTNRVNVLNELSFEVATIGDHAKAMKLANEAFDMANKLKFKKGAAISLLRISRVHQLQGEYPQALKSLYSAQRIAETLKDDQILASVYSGIGIIFRKQGNFTEALKHYDLALKLFLKMGDARNTAIIYMNIGTVQLDQRKHTVAQEYYYKALDAIKKTNNQLFAAGIHHNLSILFWMKGENAKKAGDMKLFEKEYAMAIQHAQDALAVQKEMDDNNGMAGTLASIGRLYAGLSTTDRNSGSNRLAREYLNDGIALSLKIDSKEALIKNYDGLYLLDSTEGNFKAAIEDYKLLVSYRDSLLNEENNKQIVKMKTVYETEKKDAEISLLNKDAELQANEIIRQRLMRNAFIGGFVLTLGLAGVSYRSYRRKKRDNTIITAQKEVVEKKNHAILESITYARKLQEAVLPPPKVVKEFFADSFLLYLPRDIVSGDFYWMESKDGVSLFALGDCTGHGVPGAMLSVMGLNGLNRALNELHITQPADFLTQLTKDLHDAFQRSDSMVRDGMDLSICALDSTNRKLTYAGANNPLWIARNGEIIVHKPNKRPVGHHDMEGEGFSQITIDLQAGDTIYLMTDGYADQLGGPNGLKMMTKVFRERLAALSSLPLPQQREQLIADLDAWKGSGSQTDDVCVMGVRV